jgi:hypothetical protein
MVMLQSLLLGLSLEDCIAPEWSLVKNVRDFVKYNPLNKVFSVQEWAKLGRKNISQDEEEEPHTGTNRH